MESIINPMIFYWINTLNKLQNVLTGLAIVGIVVFIVVTVIGVSLVTDNMSYGEDDQDYKNGKNLLKISNKVLIITIIIGCFAVFIPSKTTCAEMLVAKFATYDNATWTIESLKESVNYIVEQFALLK